jgi:predicted nucleic acid-binding protein
VLARQVGPETAALAHADLLELPVALVPYAPLAHRAWELRHTLTSYYAAYVALAEQLDAPMATLDARLARAPGPGCSFVVAGG